jgi:hypothetical protein
MLLPESSNDAAWKITPGGGLPSQFTSFLAFSYMSLVIPFPLCIARMVILSYPGLTFYGLLRILHMVL